MDQKDPSGVWLTLQQHTDVVEERLRIVNLVKQLIEHRALVTIGLPGHDATYNSAVLAIDTDRDLITLDELIPREGHELLRQTGHCSVFGRVKGVAIYFAIDILEIAEERGIACYRAPLPSLIFHGQRRNHYRIHVGLGTQAPLRVGDQDNPALAAGRMRDLSIGGVGAAFPLNTPIEQGMQLPHCTVDLPGLGVIDCRLEVRFIKRDEERRELVVGLRFIDLHPQHERAVQRCVCMLERDELRRCTAR
jgi:c-di-GMP-binding flagellar brake protein YcgR